MRRVVPTLILAASAATAAGLAAQQPMGTVATHDALVTGGLEVHGERATLVSNTAVTAYDRTAPIALARGGEVLVCSTSQFHLLHSGPGTSLVFALDRGAFELRSASQQQDVILTPDLRFTMASSGPLDLRLRVTPNGDTCVENDGLKAPVLAIGDSFSNATYRLLPGQHVLFEHGNLREVVDHEHSSCGCPPAGPVNVLGANASTAAAQASQEHPFPLAQSQGLAPNPEHTMPPPGTAETQMSSTLAYNAGDPVPAAGTPAASPSAKPTAAEPHDFAGAIAAFFHRLFHRDHAKQGQTPQN